MALLRKFNYILDTVDNIVEKVSKDEVKVLLELGLVKNCVDVRGKTTEEFDRYATRCIAKDKITGGTLHYGIIKM